jgi:hypothetical protein
MQGKISGTSTLWKLFLRFFHSMEKDIHSVENFGGYLSGPSARRILAETGIFCSLWSLRSLWKILPDDYPRKNAESAKKEEQPF